jgi:hypothetical protein
MIAYCSPKFQQQLQDYKKGDVIITINYNPIYKRTRDQRLFKSEEEKKESF